jgi:cell division protein FtsN
MIIPSAKEGTPTVKTGAAVTAPKTATVTPTPKPTPRPATDTASPAKSAGEGGYSVQVAAYNVKSQAQAMAAKLKKQGYDARVSGTSAPFRVRIGHYPTQAQASAVMRSLKAKQIEGFVVKAE